MRGIGEGEGVRVIDDKPSSRGGPAGLLALVLAACSSQEGPRPDELVLPDASMGTTEVACPDGVITWRDALLYWDEIRCTATAGCFPDKFAAWYGDQAGCMAALGAHHCKGGVPENWCDFPYPRDRCELLLVCRDDAEALGCDPDASVPASCDDALQ